MLKVMKKFGGAVMLYLVIFLGIVAISSRVGYINQMELTTTTQQY